MIFAMADACSGCEVAAGVARALNETVEKVRSKKDARQVRRKKEEVRSREDTIESEKDKGRSEKDLESMK